MRKTTTLGVSLVAVLLVLGACSGPAPTSVTPPAAGVSPPATALPPASPETVPSPTPAPTPAPYAMPEPSPAATVMSPDLKFDNLKITVTHVSPGDPIPLSIDVTNNAVITGTYTITVNVDGTPAKSQNVTIDADVTLNVQFTITIKQAGRHEITVGNQKGEVDVGGVA